MLVHIISLRSLRGRWRPVVKIFAISMVKLGPAGWVVLVSVEDRLPGFLDELDDPVGVGSVGVVALIPHG